MKNRIRDLREDHDLSQQRLASCIGITQRKYSYIETGTQPLTDEILIKLADFYHVSIDDDQSGLIDMTCMQTFSKISDEDGDYSTIALNDTIPPIGAMLFTIYISYTPNKIIDYTDSLIGEYKIDDSITGTIITTYICKYTLYYMER